MLASVYSLLVPPLLVCSLSIFSLKFKKLIQWLTRMNTSLIIPCIIAVLFCHTGFEFLVFSGS